MAAGLGSYWGSCALETVPFTDAGPPAKRSQGSWSTLCRSTERRRMQMKVTRQIPVVVLLSLTLGCASTYVPREPGRISIARTTGGTALVKDGRRYDMGGLSSEVIEAVSGNLAAENEARTYVRRTRIGLGLFTLGIAAAVAGGVMLKHGDGHQTRNGVAIGLEVGWVVAWIAGLATLGTGQGHFWNAVNIYNDGISGCLGK